MHRLLIRAAVTAAVALSMIGFGVAGTAEAAPTTSAVTQHRDPAVRAYIYGYYRLWADCDIVGFYGVLQGSWRQYGCDSRYRPGYFALVIYG